MSDISKALRDMVVDRARGRCEYCRLAQAGQEATFHIDHIQPRAASGLTVIENLALACVSCSLHKSARQMAHDADWLLRSIIRGLTHGLSISAGRMKSSSG
jgi:hypothetical protein